MQKKYNIKNYMNEKLKWSEVHHIIGLLYKSVSLQQCLFYSLRNSFFLRKVSIFTLRKHSVKKVV